MGEGVLIGILGTTQKNLLAHSSQVFFPNFFFFQLLESSIEVVKKRTKNSTNRRIQTLALSRVCACVRETERQTPWAGHLVCLCFNSPSYNLVMTTATLCGRNQEYLIHENSKDLGKNLAQSIYFCLNKQTSTELSHVFLNFQTHEGNVFPISERSEHKSNLSVSPKLTSPQFSMQRASFLQPLLNKAQ